MSGRGAWLLAALLGVGVVGGYAAASARADLAVTTGPAAPVVASSPSVPVDPLPPVTPDPAVAALGTDLPLHEETLGAGGFAVRVPVPDGWVRNNSEVNEAKWKVAGNPSNTFVLRIERVASQRQTIAAVLAQRIVDIDAEQPFFEVLEKTNDSLQVRYVFDGYLRYGLLTWLDLSGSGDAEVEVAVTGRERDLPGLQALMSDVVAGVHPAV
jgi:hypothetical protein